MATESSRMSAPCLTSPGMHDSSPVSASYLLSANDEPDAALDQVAGLLVRMGMERQDSPFA